MIFVREVLPLRGGCLSGSGGAVAGCPQASLLAWILRHQPLWRLGQEQDQCDNSDDQRQDRRDQGEPRAA